MSKKKFLAIYAKSFNWAGAFLPKETYEDCSSLYNFCRTVDDIADCDDKLSMKVQKLNTFIDSFNSKKCDDEIIRDMKRLIIKYNISDKIIFDLFDGIKTDLVERLEFLSEKEIFLYSYRVAGTVGLMMAKILRVNDRAALLGAIDLGIAMQLTNISRDVIEDKMSYRYYIESSFSDLKNTIGIADKFYDNAFFSIRAIPFRMRFAIIVARRVYRRIGYKVLKCGNFENYEKSGRVYVRNFEKIFETILSLFDLLRLSFAKRSANITTQYHRLINEDIDYNARF